MRSFSLLQLDWATVVAPRISDQPQQLSREPAMAMYLQSRAHSPTEQNTANCINYQPANSHNLYYMSWPTGRGSRRLSCCALNCATRRLSSMASPPSLSASMAAMPSSFSSALTQCARTNHVVGCPITNFDICNECGIGIPHLLHIDQPVVVPETFGRVWAGGPSVLTSVDHFTVHGRIKHSCSLHRQLHHRATSQ